MIATIGGITVMGSPDEIKRFKEIMEEKKKSNHYFDVPQDNVPQHIKDYQKGFGSVFTITCDSKNHLKDTKSWF